MGILTDWQIQQEKIITPFEPGLKRENKISYGCSSYGYDARIGYKFKVFSPIGAKEIDPKNFDPKALVDVDLSPIHHWTVNDQKEVCWICKHCRKVEYVYSEKEMSTLCRGKSDHILIPPHSFVLGETFETFDIPRSTLAVVLGKSTYARCGLIVNVTPLEPEWKGKVTVEISNTTPLPARIYCGEGIMQVLLFRSDSAHPMTKERKGPYTCNTSYADKKGKYQDQTGLTLPAVDQENQ